MDPYDVIKRFGLDGLRYYFLHEVTLGSDGAYSEELLTERYNKDLADELGNLVRRALTMVHKYAGGKYPKLKNELDAGTVVAKTAQGLSGRLVDLMERFQLRDAVGEIWLLVRAQNRFIDEVKPWVLAKDETKRDQLDQCLATLLEGLRQIAIALVPFLPRTAHAILKQLSLSSEVLIKDLDTWGKIPPGSKVEKPTVLFPKIDINRDSPQRDTPSV